MTSKKLVAVCLRLFALGTGMYLIFTLIASALMFGGLHGRLFGVFAVLGIAAALLFIYAIPLARLMADDIDRS